MQKQMNSKSLFIFCKYYFVRQPNLGWKKKGGVAGGGVMGWLNTSLHHQAPSKPSRPLFSPRGANQRSLCTPPPRREATDSEGDGRGDGDTERVNEEKESEEEEGEEEEERQK